MEHSNHHHHDDEHQSHHALPITGISRAFIIGISLNLLFVITEVIAGLSVHSLSLLSDAGHNLADVAALALSMLAFHLVKVKPTEQYTYGYSKTTILAALFNAVILLVSIGAIGYEAAHRFMNPEPLPGKLIALVAFIGILINATTALMFFSNKDKDLNIKSAYLHLLSDAIVSLGIVIGGVLIYYTNYFWIDSVLSIIIALVILFSTWNLLKQSLRLSLDGVPADISVEKVINAAKQNQAVKDIHHIHLWAISTTQNALTAHIVVDKNTSLEKTEEIKNDIKHRLEHLNIHHATLEVETPDKNCETKEC